MRRLACITRPVALIDTEKNLDGLSKQAFLNPNHIIFFNYIGYTRFHRLHLHAINVPDNFNGVVGTPWRQATPHRRRLQYRHIALQFINTRALYFAVYIEHWRGRHENNVPNGDVHIVLSFAMLEYDHSVDLEPYILPVLFAQYGDAVAAVGAIPPARASISKR